MMYLQSIDQAKGRLGVDLDGWLDASLGIPAGQAGIDLFLPFFFLLFLSFSFFSPSSSSSSSP